MTIRDIQEWVESLRTQPRARSYFQMREDSPDISVEETFEGQ